MAPKSRFGIPEFSYALSAVAEQATSHASSGPSDESESEIPAVFEDHDARERSLFGRGVAVAIRLGNSGRGDPRTSSDLSFDIDSSDKEQSMSYPKYVMRRRASNTID